MAQFKLGRRAPLWTPRHHAMAARMHAAFASLGQPPVTPTYDYVAAVTSLVGWNWGMMANDRVGDCVDAGVGHVYMANRANNGTWTHVPTDDEVLALYTATTGYDPTKTDAQGNNPTDQGSSEADVCDYLVSTGFLGDRALVTAPLLTGTTDDEGLDKVRWCIELFGACVIGVNLPNEAQNQFAAGTPWALGGDETVEGGHCVVLFDYSSEDFFAVTWGGQPKDPRGLQRVTGDWMKKFNEEAHAVLWTDQLMSTGKTPAGFDVAQLTADLKTLAAA